MIKIKTITKVHDKEKKGKDNIKKKIYLTDKNKIK